MSRARDGDSAGEAAARASGLRAVPPQLEAAIASLGQSSSHEANVVNGVERTPQGRVLVLSDHKRIANLEAALTAVATAYRQLDEERNRNLVGTVAKKLHELLFWMVTREINSGVRSGGVVDLLLEWLQSTDDKQNQLAAGLIIFELAQRDRRDLKDTKPRQTKLFLLGEQTEQFTEALRKLIADRATSFAGCQRLKPSKLSLIALEALALLCANISTVILMEEGNSFVDDLRIRGILEGMRTVTVALQQWHLRSTRRQFLCCCVRHLQDSIDVCYHLLLRADIKEENSIGAVRVLCWHWQSIGPLLSTRSDASISIKTSRPSEILARVVKNTGLTMATAAQYFTTMNPELVYNQLHYVCLLMNTIGGPAEHVRVFQGFTAEVKSYFVFLFVESLVIAARNCDELAIHFIVKVLRIVFLPSDVLQLVATPNEDQEVFSRLLRCLECRPTNNVGGRAELELFVVDYMIAKEVFNAKLVMRVRDVDGGSGKVYMSLAQTFLHQLDRASLDSVLHRCWRKELTSAISKHI